MGGREGVSLDVVSGLCARLAQCSEELRRTRGLEINVSAASSALAKCAFGDAKCALVEIKGKTIELLEVSNRWDAWACRLAVVAEALLCIVEERGEPPDAVRDFACALVGPAFLALAKERGLVDHVRALQVCKSDQEGPRSLVLDDAIRSAFRGALAHALKGHQGAEGPAMASLEAKAVPDKGTPHSVCQDLQGPTVLRGMASNWPAVKGGEWSHEALARRHGARLVPVECRGDFTDQGMVHALATLDELCVACAGSGGSARPYLAQHDLLDQIPELRAGVDFAGLQQTMRGMECASTCTWIGPGGSISPLHRDPDDNLFVQVVGAKVFHILEPSFDGGGVKEGQRKTLRGLEGAPLMRCKLVAGDALFLPSGWWHHVRSLSPAVSINFWLRDAGED